MFAELDDLLCQSSVSIGFSLLGRCSPTLDVVVVTPSSMRLASTYICANNHIRVDVGQNMKHDYITLQLLAFRGVYMVILRLIVNVGFI